MSNEKRIHPEGKPGFEYTDSFGDPYVLYPKFGMYSANNNLFLGFDYFDTEWNSWDSYCDATVNIKGLPFLYTVIDTNNNGDKMVDFLEKNGFGERTGHLIPSGYCMFPVFKLNEDKIKEIDSNFYEEYAKAHGREPKVSLKEKLENAKMRAGNTSTDNQQVPQKAMTAIRTGYDKFELYLNEDIEGINLKHGGGQVKVDGVIYQLREPVYMSDAIKLDKTSSRFGPCEVGHYFCNEYKQR